MLAGAEVLMDWKWAGGSELPLKEVENSVAER
jgi:hypothetical protein